MKRLSQSLYKNLGADIIGWKRLFFAAQGFDNVNGLVC